MEAGPFESVLADLSRAEVRYLVIPLRPAGTGGWSEEKLAGLVTRDSMIGTGLALQPGEAG